jgi:hypothetical protein
MCVEFKLISTRMLIFQIQDEVHFRVNSDKFNVHIRNAVRQIGCERFFFLYLKLSASQLIETAARERFNESTAVVMRAILKATEFKQRDISEVRSGSFSVSAPNVFLMKPFRADFNLEHCDPNPR